MIKIRQRGRYPNHLYDPSEIITRYQQGDSMNKIAHDLGISYTTVNRKLHQAKISLERNKSWISPIR